MTTAEKVADKVEVDKAAPDKRKALGRGLDSLLPGPRVVSAAAPAMAAAGAPGVPIGDLQGVAAKTRETVLEIAVEAVDKNPYQTRYFTKDELGEEAKSLRELADSIAANGVIQPITVRPGKNGRYLLITGERRWRASKMAGKDKVPAIVREVSDQQAAEMTVVENLQRQDLNCLDQARAFVMLSQTFHMTQEQIGQQVGVSRETVSNYMRLVRLPENVLMFLQQGQLDYSHARLLLNLDDPTMASTAAETAVKKFLSVEQLEDLILRLKGMLPLPSTPAQGRARWVDPNVRAAQRDLERVLGVKVRIRDRKGKGKIVIEYATLEDFDRVLEMLKGKQ